jgi:hypothetical protein
MNENDVRRQLSTRIAEAVHGRGVLSLLQLLSNGSAQPGNTGGDGEPDPLGSLAEDLAGLMNAKAEPGRRTVGIWREDPATGEFVRSSEHFDLWKFCAQVERIPRKSTRKRIVFLGESVARGFFFDPFYCPADVLRAILGRAGADVEVVDLAQSNCDALWLSITASAARALEPDALVVFAGNNWRPDPLAGLSAESLIHDGALVTANGGFAELARLQRRRVEELATRAVQHLCGVAADARVPLVLVIPEINLADWSNCPDGTLDVPVMSASDTVAWSRAFDGAGEALRDGRFDEAEELAAIAVVHDGATSSAALELLARARLALGDARSAAATLRQSRDLTVGFLGGPPPVPGVFPDVAEAIRRVGARLGATIVDLPRIFSDHTAHEPPGRRLFLDYCHLTSEGIRVAMAATARAVLSQLCDARADRATLLADAPAPTREQEGWAHLLAGIHNAHWGQPVATCSPLFRRALEHHPALGDAAMPRVYDAFRRAAPAILSESFDQLAGSEIAAVYLLGYGMSLRSIGRVNEHRLLISLSEACPALAGDPASFDPDFALGDSDELDLLDRHWSELTDGNRWYRRAFVAAYGLRSEFLFACTAPRELALTLTARVPDALESGIVAVELNGHEVCRSTCAGSWISQRCPIGAGLVTRGLNRVVVRWPIVARADVRERMRRELEAGRRIDPRRHFGQLAELRLSLPGAAGAPAMMAVTAH